MHEKMRAVKFLMLLFLFVTPVVKAQSPASVLENRLCKTWKLERMEQGSKVTTADKALNDFVMIINDDHTIKQGINPDGLISGKWSIDEKTMMLSIHDDTTGQEYKMKVTTVTQNELVLEDTASNPVLYIHYLAK